MNVHDEHLDPLLAEALDAMDEQSSGELIARICALTDSALTEALDRAIGPRSVACDDEALVGDILAATTHRPAVVGRIFGVPLTAAWRIAAMVALAAGLYLVFTAFSPVATGPTNPGPVAMTQDDGSVMNELERELDLLSQADERTIDQQIAQVSAGVDQIATDALWADSPDALVDRAAESVDWYEVDSEGVPAWF